MQDVHLLWDKLRLVKSLSVANFTFVKIAKFLLILFGVNMK